MTVFDDLVTELLEQLKKVDSSELVDELGYFTPPQGTDLRVLSEWTKKHPQSAIYWNFRLKHRQM
jgi:hypothetical protein